MAVTHVDSTHYFNDAVNYVVSGKPHNDDEYIQGQRALMVDSVNASSDPDDFKSEVNSFLKHNPMTRTGTATGIRTIISFGKQDDLDYRNYKDRKTALAIGKWVAQHKYPHNQSLIVLQADGNNHWLHDHIITCTRRLDNGLSSNSGATQALTVPYTDKAVQQFGIEPLHANLHRPQHNTSIAPNKIISHGRYSYMKNLHHLIRWSCKYANSREEFMDNLKSNHIYIRPMQKLKKNKKTGQYEYHYYSHPTPKHTYYKITSNYVKQLYKNDPKIAKNSNLKAHIGQYLRRKKHITYVFNDNGKTRVVRDKALGADTGFKAINRQLEINNNDSYAQILTPTSSGVSNANSNNGNVSTNIFKSTKQSTKSNQPKGSIKALGITKSKHTFKEYLYHTDSQINIHGIYKPYINTPHLKEPIMKFQPKSHDLSKAINDLTRVLNRIKNATQDGSDKQKELIDQAYEDSLLRKKQAQKVNEINNENRAIYTKVATDNFNQKRAYYQQQALYLKTLHEAQRERYFHR